jgi:septin family protein
MLPPVVSENGYRMKLTITDTPGFGDQVDNSDWYERMG